MQQQRQSAVAAPVRMLTANPAVADRPMRRLDAVESADGLGRVVEASRGRAEHCSVYGVRDTLIQKGVKLSPFSFAKTCPYLGFY